MAKDVITRFKLETTGFDSKIKEAAKELSAYSKTATQAKEGFNQFTKANVDAAKALGTIATSTTNAKDRAKELVGAFNEAAKAYNSLTKEQQQSDWAKALAGSLTQLQQRIKETKQEMQGLSSGGGLFSGDKLSGMLQVFGGNLMTKAAGAVASLGSEMAGMIKQGVELARQGEGIRIAFERLGRGDILDGLRQATHGTVTDLELMKAAVKFNDFKLPVSELGTMLAFAQQKAKDTGQSVDYMVDSIVTGLGRKSLMILDNLGLSANEVKEKMKETGDMTKAVGAIIREQMAAAGEYVETAADRATQANVSLQNKMEELGRKFGPVEEASNQLWTSIKIGILDIIGGPLSTLLNQLTEAGRLKNALNDMGGDDQVNKQLGKLRVSKAAGSGYMTRSLYSEQVEQYNRQINAANDYLSQYDQKHSSVNTVLMAASRQFGQKFDSISDLKAFRDAYLSMKNEYVKGAQEIMNATNSTKGVTTTTTGGNKKNTKTEQTELQQNQTKINALTQEYVKLGDESTEAVRERQAEIRKEIELLQQRNGLLNKRAEQAQGRLTLGAGDFQRDGLSNTPGTLLKEPDTTIPSGGLLLDDKVMKAVRKNIDDNLPKAEKKDSPMDGTKKMLNAISQLTNGLQQIGIELPAEIQGVISVIQGVTSVIEAVNTIIGITQASELTANTVAMGILTEALWANTATSWIPFANGGIVPGFANGGVIDSGHSPAFLSFSKAAPAFATGGVVPQTITSIPKFATGGIIQKFATGGTVEAGHAPDFLSFSKAMPRFATGGTIPHANNGYFIGGSHFSGDVTPIMANAGELVLNKAQQGNLASQLQGGGMQNLNLTATIKGEQIRLALNNNGRRTGRGEYVQSSNRV